MTSGWTRRNALTLSGGVIAVALLTLVEGCQPVAGYHSAPSTPSAASQGNSTAYYSDGKTVLGTFGGTDQQNQVDGAPWAPYLMTQVENELTGLNGVSQQELETGGLKVVTTISRPMEVQYAMEQTTIDGTGAGAVTFGRQHPGTVISKTGTTVSAHSGFFLGATSQYALVVGMFSANVQPLSDSLSVLGGGSSAYWPTKIWNAFAAAKFGAGAAPFPTDPAFSGQAWNQAGEPAAP